MLELHIGLLANAAVKSVTALAREIAEIEKTFPEGRGLSALDPNVWHGFSVFFPATDTQCKCGCGIGKLGQHLDVPHYNRMNEARIMAGVAFNVLSWVRCDSHNVAEGGSFTSSHLTRYATDIACTDPLVRIVIVSALIKAGFTRIGIYDWGIHVDSDPSKPDALWID